MAEDTGISITNEFRIDNVAVVFDDRVSEGDLALIPGSSNYFGLLKYDYLTLSDSGSYSCTVMYQPKIENEFVRGGVLTGTPLVVDIQGTVHVILYMYMYVYTCTCITIFIPHVCTCMSFFSMYLYFINFLYTCILHFLTCIFIIH